MTHDDAKDRDDRIPRSGLVLLFGLVVGGWMFSLVGCGSDPAPTPVDSSTSTDATKESPTTYPVTIRKPHREAALDIGIKGPDGKPQMITCATCHQSKTPNAEARSDNPPMAFHQTLSHNHSNLSCISCHNPADHYSSLRLADGKSVPFAEVMQLCAQCHGTQHRDYLNGSHGGMTGHWDLTRGPRERLNCVDCHNPHSPKFPEVSPVPGSRERFPPATKEHNHE